MFRLLRHPALLGPAVGRSVIVCLTYFKLSLEGRLKV
nr:MAG TPA: hypothetical protein [Caudoviricetes sp.]